MDKKIDKLRCAMERGDWRKALAMASRFPRLGPEADAIRLAHEASSDRHFSGSSAIPMR